MVLSLADSLFITVSNDEEERPKPYPDEDPEELLRRIKEYLDASPCIDLSKLSVASDRIEAIEDVNLDSHAAELGTEPPSVLTEQTSVAAESLGLLSMSWAWAYDSLLVESASRMDEHYNSEEKCAPIEENNSETETRLRPGMKLQQHG